MQRIVDALRGEPSVAAMALGGSFARGHATAASDIDLVLFYDESQPPAPARLNAIVAALTPDATPTFTQIGEWGPWVNGGAWLSFAGQRVDVLYRSLQQCQRVLDDRAEGRWELHWAQQPPVRLLQPDLRRRTRHLRAAVRSQRGARASARAGAASIPMRCDAASCRTSCGASNSTSARSCRSTLQRPTLMDSPVRIAHLLPARSGHLRAESDVAAAGSGGVESRRLAIDTAGRTSQTRVQDVLAHIGTSAAAQTESAAQLRELWTGDRAPQRRSVRAENVADLGRDARSPRIDARPLLAGPRRRRRRRLEARDHPTARLHRIDHVVDFEVRRDVDAFAAFVHALDHLFVRLCVLPDLRSRRVRCDSRV